MNSKMKIFVVFLILFTFVGPFELFSNPENPGNGDNNEPIKILEKAHPFEDSKMLAAVVEIKEINKEKIKEINKKKIKLVLDILAKYIKNKDLQKKMKSEENWNKELGEEIKKAFEVTFEEANTDNGAARQEVNPFLKDYLDILGAALENYATGTKAATEKTDTTYKQENVEPVEAPPSTEKGFLSPTVVVDALATLIADRFKEELSIAYLKKLKEKLEKSDLSLLFPTAKDFLSSSEIFNFKLFLPNLKAAFQKDLHNWDSNLYDFLEKKAEKDEIAGSKELYLALFFLDLVKDIRAGEHPADIVDELSAFKHIDKLDPNFSNPIRLLSLASRNLRDKEGKGWIKPKDFKILIEDGGKDVRNLFIGLIYAKEWEEMEKIVFKVKIENEQEETEFVNKKLSQIIFDNKDKIKKMNDYLHSIILLAEKFENQITKMKDAEKKVENAYERYRSYMGTVVDFVELGSKLTRMFGDDDIGGKIDDFIKKARNLLVIADNVHEKQYSMAFVNTLELLKEILNDNSPTRKLIMKYMTFAVNIVTAQDAKELRKVLEAAALPVESYLVKRVNDFNISLNAYPGIFGGIDKLTTGKDLNGIKDGLNFGFAAPIGVAFSWKDKIKTNNNLETSTSLFISIIDIGAVVNWRLTGVDKGLPEFHWKNVLAPGLFLIGGLKGTPISVGAGIQYGPQLRKIELVENDPNAVIETSSLRFGFIIAVDIPIFNIYTKEKTGKGKGEE